MNTPETIMPDGLVAELTRMRRELSEFAILGLGRCKLCYKPTAINLGHSANPTNAGSWCAVHGWLAFDSVKIPPKEKQ